MMWPAPSSVTPADRVLQFSSVSFDVAAEEIFCTLTHGATLVLRTDEMIDSIALAGTHDEVRERFAERWEGVYERTLLWPPAFSGEGAVRDVVEAFRAD